MKLELQNALKCYKTWPRPDLIVSDGAYGVGGFDGDPQSPEGLGDWYLPHVNAWSAAAKPSTSLWFWNTEIGWANVHPLLASNGWDYVETVVWDKGMSHVAGNVNSKTIRQFPVATEVAVLYRRKACFPGSDGTSVDVKDWLRQEWERSGLPLYKANEACGVRNAATRKYLTKDSLWYWPPGSAVEMMAAYCTRYGLPTSRPYFSLDGTTEITAEAWDATRAVWNHLHGHTNVWSRAQLAGSERLRGSDGKVLHLNQKPLELVELQVLSSSDEGAVVWEPFGGLGTASVASVMNGRDPYYAEVDGSYFASASARIESALRARRGERERKAG